MNIDKLFSEIVGELGYQQIVYCLLFGLINVYSAFQMLQYKFVVRDTSEFQCVTQAEGSDVPEARIMNKCSLLDGTAASMTRNCKTIIYPNDDFPSVMKEWDLVCERAWMAPLTMSIFMAGVMVGAIVLGPFADKVGRRKTLSFSFTSLIIVNFAGAYAPNYDSYVFIRFLCGFFQSGVIISTFVLMNEMIGASKRALVGVAAQGMFSLGIVALTFISYYVRDWRHLTVLISILGIPLALFNIFYIPESPRWLKNIGNVKEALEVLKHIAVKNGSISKWKDNLSSTLTPKAESKFNKSQDNKMHAKIVDSNTISSLFRHPVLLQLTMIQMLSWCVNGATYYGLTLAAGSEDEASLEDSNGHIEANSNPKATPNIFISTIFSGLIELPAYIITVPLLNSCGRRKTLVLFMTIGGVSCLLISIVASNPLAQSYKLSTWLGLIGKLCISASFSVVYVHSNEIFPTTIRNSAMGIVGFAARNGGILAPFLAKLGQVLPNLHFLIFGIMTLISGFLNIYLPETKDISLPETIDDLILMQQTTKQKYIGPLAKKRNKSESGHKLLANDDSEEEGSDDLEENINTKRRSPVHNV